MLSEEEKEAIKIIEEFRDYYTREDIHKENFNNNKNYKKALNKTRKLREEFDTVLNLIARLEKGNKKLKDNNKSLLKKLRSRIKEVKKLTKYALYKKEFATLNRIIKEKDKQIDLMAEEIFFTNNDNMDTFCPRYNEKCNNKKCQDCIKQYFEVRARRGE